MKLKTKKVFCLFDLVSWIVEKPVLGYINYFLWQKETYYLIRPSFSSSVKLYVLSVTLLICLLRSFFPVCHRISLSICYCFLNLLLLITESLYWWFGSMLLSKISLSKLSYYGFSLTVYNVERQWVIIYNAYSSPPHTI